MAAMSGSAGVAGDSSLSKEIMDLKEQLRTSAKDMNIVQASVMTAEKSLKVNEITIGELEGIPMEEDRKMYRGIGKMFMMQSREEIFDHLKGEMKDDEEVGGTETKEGIFRKKNQIAATKYYRIVHKRIKPCERRRVHVKVHSAGTCS
eukprot:978218_1